MSEQPAHDHELEVLEEDQTVPPRPEEQIADAREDSQSAESPAVPGSDEPTASADLPGGPRSAP